MSKDLDINFYKYIYDDIKHLTNNEIIIHYKKYGIQECRIPNRNFFYNKFNYYNFEKYCKLHPELIGKTENDAIHFFIYNDYVDPTFYRNIYDDAKKLNDMECRNNYFLEGIKKGRLRNNNNFIEIYGNVPINFLKISFNISDTYEFINFFIKNHHNIEYLYKEYYFLLNKNYYHYSLGEMVDNNLLSNYNLFYEKYNDFNLNEYKNNCNLLFNFEIQYYTQYIIDKNKL